MIHLHRLNRLPPRKILQLSILSELTEDSSNVFKSFPSDEILHWFKLKAFCRQQNKCDSKIICFGKDRKDCRKRRKLWLPAFSPCPTMISKGFFLRVIKNQDCAV